MNFAQDAIKEMSILYERAKQECEKLIRELSSNECETNDILHYLEFEDFAFDVGYSVAVKLKKLRLARRRIKDELEPLQILTSMLDSQKLVEIQKRIDTKISKRDDRLYSPRVIMSGLAEAVNS